MSGISFLLSVIAYILLDVFFVKFIFGKKDDGKENKK